MAYELWDTMSRTIVGAYTDEADALAVVRDVLRRDGDQAVATLLLAHEDRRGRTATVAAGAELAERAMATDLLHAEVPVAGRRS